jgi:hypothetical protein
MRSQISTLLAVLVLRCGVAHPQANQAQPATPSPSPVAQSIPVDQQNTQKARAWLDRMIEALGGQAYLSFEDILQEGRTYSFHLGRPNSVGIVFWRFYKYPDQDRVELTKTRDVVEVFSGDRGFEITYKGTRQYDNKEQGDYLRRRHYSLEWVLRKWLPEPGVALFDEGPGVAAQKPVERVTIMNARNEAVTLSIDSETHLPVKKSYSWRDPTDQQRNVEDEVYDNYRPVQGIMTPFDITRFYNGDMSNQRFLTAVSFNKPLSDTLFRVGPTYDPVSPASKQ